MADRSVEIPTGPARGSLDLHLHSRISDGRLSPGDLVRLAHAQGVRTMALSDHDNTDGVPEARAVGAELGVRVIPGIELSTDLPGASIHVLGLFLEYQQSHFQEAIRTFREARVVRVHRMAEALGGLDAGVSVGRIFEIAGEGTVGRPHVAQALLEAGHVETIAEAFDRFIGHGGPAYFEGYRMEPAEGIQLIHSVGGLAVWAHPYELDGKDWRAYLPALVEAGVDGIEVYYGKDYGPLAVEDLLEACAMRDLVPTVGSDFHGFKSMDRLPGSVASPPELLERLERRVEQLRARA